MHGASMNTEINTSMLYGVYEVVILILQRYGWTDAVSTQSMGPITVSSSLELAEKKERWRKNLLHAKRSHTNYQG